MDESINNMYFLKETITKFKSEIQKFIQDPEYANNNAMNLRNSLEDLEKSINSKEKTIAGQILNNNNLQFNPISSKYTSLSNSTINPKLAFSDRLNNLTLGEMGATNFSKSSKKLFKITNKDKDISDNKNSPKLFSPKETRKFNKSQQDKTQLNQELLWAVQNIQKQINNTNSNFDHTFGNMLNNRTTVPIDIKGVSQHYDLKYLTKKIALANEASCSPKTEKREFFVRNNLVTREISPDEEKTKYKNTVLLRRVNDEIYDKVKNAEDSRKYKLEKLKLLEKYDIARKEQQKIKVKRSVGNVNYMDRQRLNKFAFDKKSFFKSVNLDKNNVPIITPDEVEKGLLSMITRGIIPKEADLTPAFNRDGHPITLAGGLALREIYRKDNIRDEIELDNRRSMDRIKFDIKEGNGFFVTSDRHGDRTKDAVRVYNPSSRNHRIKSSDKSYSINKDISEISELEISNLEGDKYEGNNDVDNYASNDSENNIRKGNNIAQKSEISHKKMKKKNSNLNAQNEKEINLQDADYTQSYYKTEMMLKSEVDNGQITKKENTQENNRYEAKKGNINIKNYDVTSDDEYNNNEFIYNNPNAIKTEDDDNSMKETISRNLLKFRYFEVEKNEAYSEFHIKNLENWGKINQILNYISKLFRKLNFTNEDIDCRKLKELALDELRAISNRDIISLMSEICLNKHGFSDKKAFHLNLKEAFIIRIQTHFRKFLAKKKYKERKNYQRKVKKIQTMFRLYKLRKIWEKLLIEKKEESVKKIQEIMQNFKENWPVIKEGKRIEIHINSYSFKNQDNLTFEKFNEKQNNQLNRMVNLKDPNLEIIYVCPFQIGNEVLSYYFSILSTLGVENAKERFHLVVPEEINKLSTCYSLSQMLIFSSNSLRKIRTKIRGKIAYIIPGIISSSDHFLSRILEIPIYASELELTKSIFTKSGNKRIFELNNIPFPTSAWDVENELEFYDSLTDLINKYMNVNVWIFKMDSEINGRGIAHLQLDKSKIFIELKTEKIKNSISEETFISDLKLFLMKSLGKFVEFAAPNLYKNFKEFLKKFIEEKGVIESCPTNMISNINGSPCISMNIEPDGKLELLGTYDKLNANYFRNYINISPQKSLNNFNAELLVDKIGEYLYSIEIFGYITIEFITFFENSKQIQLAIDLKYGINDTISCIKFCDFLDFIALNRSNNMTSESSVRDNVNNLLSPVLNTSIGSSPNNINPKSKVDVSPINRNSSLLYKKEKTDFSHIKKPFKDMEKHFRFYIPIIMSEEVSSMKMKDLVQLFRNELLIFDLEKCNGIVFNLPDIIQCSMFGICGIANTHNELMHIFEKTMILLKQKIFNKEKNFKAKMEVHKNKLDSIDFFDMTNRIKSFLNNNKKA